MKLKTAILIVSFLLLNSCSDDIEWGGFSFNITNLTNQEIYDAELFIGGIKDGEFIATASVPIEYIKKEPGFLYYYKGADRWQPNLQTIQNIPSTQYHFKLKLSEEREAILEWYDADTPFGIDVNEQIKGRIGDIYIYIDEDRIVGDNE